MEDFQSKYSGEQVEEFLDQIANGEIGGGGGAEEVYIGEEEPTNPSIELWVDESIVTDNDGNVLDSEMSDSSGNAVQNKVIKAYVDTIVGNIDAILDNINGEVI
jgi:hypothetical protein